jgi:hypothetical protein
MAAGGKPSSGVAGVGIVVGRSGETVESESVAPDQSSPVLFEMIAL